MASMFFIVWLVILVTFFAIIVSSTKASVRFPSRRKTISSDGHVVPRSQDLTCETEYGHVHPKSAVPRYIVHEDPDEGFVVLNGIKRRLEDCRYL